MKISKTAVTQTASGFEQELSYTRDGKLRREIFAAYSRERLTKEISERVRELEKS